MKSMSDKDVQMIRRISKDTIYEILDAEVLGPLLDAFSGLEASITQFKHAISQAKGIQKWDPDKITWKQAEGASGPYERSDDVNNPEFKAMLRDLAAHNGKLTREGWFHWIFRNGSTVGRKKQKRFDGKGK